MKQVEQGSLDWTDNLSNRLHEHYVFRANVNLRRKVESEGFTKVEKRSDRQEKNDKVPPETERIVYCQEFNKKACLQQTTMRGILWTGRWPSGTSVVNVSS